ncbi:AbrB/MazE/SpoVT family DNA-binding domain-containing protein [Fusobacterium gonidiaformans]|nr:AbrB/MazE/SpoVT family DNA-binding domain-containing protein [Fusobacterium gonidiaformans]
MEKRKGKLLFHKSGNGKACKINIPMPWMRKMKMNEDEREVEISFDEENKKIIIEKSSK